MDASLIPPLPDDPALKAWIDSLLSKNSSLTGENNSLVETNNSLTNEVERLREYIRLLIHKRFGAASEKASPDQMKLFV